MRTTVNFMWTMFVLLILSIGIYAALLFLLAGVGYMPANNIICKIVGG